MRARIRLTVIAACALAALSTAYAEVRVDVGPTAIPRGDAQGERDITVSNGLFAVAFAVDTAPPWGVARGGILDIALVDDSGEIGYDIASLADFMPNRWSSWPTTYQEVSIESATADEVVILTRRDWGRVELISRFYIGAGSSKVRIVTEMRNGADTPLNDLYSGYVAWPDGGSLFGVAGLHMVESGSENEALGDWSAAYGEDWLIGLHAPFADFLDFGGRDRYQRHALQPGESRTFEAWLQIEPAGSLAPMVAAEIGFLDIPAGQLSGTVETVDGSPVQRPAVIVMRDERIYTWVIGDGGDYALRLPVGTYDVYATARAHGRSTAQSVTIEAGSSLVADFADVAPPAAVHFEVRESGTGRPLDARIELRQGPRAVVEFYGRNTLFTELQDVGRLATALAPGDYEFTISSGGGFTSRPEHKSLRVRPGATSEVVVDIDVLARPVERGWYSADLHHHSDVLDGFTEPEFVMRAQLAAGVDLAFLSDHDSVVNNQRMADLAAARARLFIPGAELSPSWAHFNAYPLARDEDIGIDVGQSTVQQIFDEARRMGADVIEVNHPYSQYGYFEALEQGAVPGGYDSRYDLVELEPAVSRERNVRTLARVWDLWNVFEPRYLAGGSDAHDVWNEVTGSARTFVPVDGDLSVESFVASLKAGRGVASQGPLVYPEVPFGSTLTTPAGQPLQLRYEVQAVAGLATVTLIERGQAIATRAFEGPDGLVDVVLAVVPEQKTWYALIVEDEAGNRAYTNPLWVTLDADDGATEWR